MTEQQEPTASDNPPSPQADLAEFPASNPPEARRARGGIDNPAELASYRTAAANALDRLSVASSGISTQTPPPPPPRTRRSNAKLAAEHRAAMHGAVSAEQVAEIMQGLVVKALAGDRLSAIAVLDRLLGAPLPIDVAKRVERLSVLLTGTLPAGTTPGQLLSAPAPLDLPLIAETPDSAGNLESIPPEV